MLISWNPLLSTDYFFLRSRIPFSNYFIFKKCQVVVLLISIGNNAYQRAYKHHGINRKNLMRENKSAIEFWVGVPVRHHLYSALSSYTVLAIAVLLFLKLWASSITIRNQLRFLIVDSSAANFNYDLTLPSVVITTLLFSYFISLNFY